MDDHVCCWSQMKTLLPIPPSPQLEAAKKAYHLACKEEKLAMTREMNSKTEQSVTPEQQKKLQDKVDKCKQDVQKVLAGGDGSRMCRRCWPGRDGNRGSGVPLQRMVAGSCRPG